MNGARDKTRGFTLIELLVVMAIIAIFVGGLGLALSGGDGTVATQAGQRSLTTMMSAARSQAILKQAPTRLIIHVDPPLPGDTAEVREEKRQKYLRFMAVVVREGGQWKEVGNGTYLPRGVYFVPPIGFNAPDAGGSVPQIPTTVIDPSTGAWSHDRRTVTTQSETGGTKSVATMEHAHGWEGIAPPTANDLRSYIFIEFSGRGTTSSTTEILGNNYEQRIVLAPARATPLGPVFESGGDRLALGGMVRFNGSLTLVSGADSFPENR